MKKTTDNLWKEMMNTDNVDEYLENNPDDVFFNGLEEFFEYQLKTKKLKSGKVYEAAMIERHFGHQIITGTRGATRDKIIQLCFGLTLNLREAQQFIKISGNRELYPRDPRDAVIIFAIKDGKSLMDVNIELQERGLSVFE
ncbi:MAG: hypothetical protein IJT79_00870 [Ruminococcus sp.]|nr:hypothetical protein [Ruminococcus sp.]